MPAGSSARNTCVLLAASLANPTFTPFHGADITLVPRVAVNLGAPPTPDSPIPDFGIKADPTSL